MTTTEMLVSAKAAARRLASLSSDEKNSILNTIARALEERAEDILSANKTDLENARGKLSQSMIDRLTLSEKRIKDMADGIRSVASLDDPVGRVLYSTERENGILIEKKAVPFGVIAIIYESRPNVTSDAAALCIKSGNACVLRSGKDAYESSSMITRVMRDAIASLGYDPSFVNIVSDPSRESARELMEAKGLVDLLIPRGGKGLIKATLENASVPCIETGTGICHIYVDKYADLDKALKIIENAKTSRPSVCNAAEVLLVHEDVKDALLPSLKALLVDRRAENGLVPVELRLDSAAASVIDGSVAGEQDFDTEFLDYILAVKVVKDVNEAIDHIALHSTSHSEAIITENTENASLFTASVDSAAVYVNVSTRFTDGGEFGFGCEMGISTQKLHARGPMGLSELCTYKYVIKGNGQIR